jgi:hypothetical protein
MRDTSFNKLVQLLETVEPTLSTDNKQLVKERHTEVRIARNQIEQIIRNAHYIKKILDALPSEHDIEAKVQVDITLADKRLADAYEGMAFEYKGLEDVASGDTMEEPALDIERFPPSNGSAGT